MIFLPRRRSCHRHAVFPVAAAGGSAGQLGGAARSGRARVPVASSGRCRRVLELLISVLHVSEEGSSRLPPPTAAGDRSARGRRHGRGDHRAGRSPPHRASRRIRRQARPRRDDAAPGRGRHPRRPRRWKNCATSSSRRSFRACPSFEKSLDDIVGIVMARDMLEVPDREAAHRTVRELMRPALFVPETKFGSELLEGNAAQESADGHRN